MTENKEEIAKKFEEALKEGKAPWVKPWRNSEYTIRNGITGHKYRGMNLLKLMLTPFSDTRYCTFIQAKNKGWRIKKGSKGQLIRYTSIIINEDEEFEKECFIQKYYTVFNFEQIEGAPAFKTSEKGFELKMKVRDISQALNICIKEDTGSNYAYYSKDFDYIVVPNHERFLDEASFLRTLLHEIAHATGAAKRLDRKVDYPFEELVAEITSFLVGQYLGCGSEPHEESLSYVNYWLRKLGNNKKYILEAIQYAEKAEKWILSRLVMRREISVAL